jgi:hypothetical protein
MLEKIEAFLISNVKERDHNLYKLFLKILKNDNTSIIQYSLDRYTLINSKEQSCIILGNKVMEIIQNGNIIMTIPHEYILEKMISKTKEEIDSKIEVLNNSVDLLRINCIKKLI